MSQLDYFIAKFFKACSNTHDLKDLLAKNFKNLLKIKKMIFTDF